MQYRDLIYRIHARQGMFTRSISDCAICFIRTQSCGERTMRQTMLNSGQEREDDGAAGDLR